jgi:hypothetical protein
VRALPSRVAPVMGTVIMRMSPEAPARCKRRAGGIADDPTRNQADRTSDQATRQGAKRTVAKPLLRICGSGKEKASRGHCRN